MTTPAEYAYAQTVIARYTRDGYTQWANVAQVLGRHIESVKREFDLDIPPMPFAVETPPPPKPRGIFPRTRAKVLIFLLRGPSNSISIAGGTGMQPKAVRARLAELHADNLVQSDGAWGRATCRTWIVTDQGREFATSLTSPRAPSREEQAA